MSKKKVVTREDRRKQAVSAGVAMAAKTGVAEVSLAAVAAKLKITPPLLFHIFGTAKKFRAVLVKAGARATVRGKPKDSKKVSVAKAAARKPFKSAKAKVLKAHAGAKPIGKVTKVKTEPKAVTVTLKLTNGPKIAKAVDAAKKAIKAIPKPKVTVVKPPRAPKLAKFPSLPTPQLPLIEGVAATAGLE